MDAMKRFKGTRAERRAQEWIIKALEHYLLASALVLHDDFGFGSGRIQRFMQGMMGRMDAYIDNYGDDCLLAALRAKCRDIGIEVEL